MLIGRREGEGRQREWTRERDAPKRKRERGVKGKERTENAPNQELPNARAPQQRRVEPNMQLRVCRVLLALRVLELVVGGGGGEDGGLVETEGVGEGAFEAAVGGEE